MADATPPGAARRGVLITRPAQEAASTADRVAELGYTPVLAPLLQVSAMAVRATPCDGVVVTSGNAVPALVAAGLLSAPVFAVGDATAARLRAAGFAQVHSANGDAADLVGLVRRRCAPGALLLFGTGRGVGHATAAALRAAGFRVRRRVAYAARPVRRLPDAAAEALRAGRLHAALFLSAETARTFGRVLPAALHPALRGTDALAIGQPAAEALAPLPWRRVRVSLSPTLEQVLALL